LLVSLDYLIAKVKYPSKEKLISMANNRVKQLYESKKPFIDSSGVKHFITKKQYDSLIE